MKTLFEVSAPALYQGNRKVDATLVYRRYGPVWLLSREEAMFFGRTYVPYDVSHLELNPEEYEGWFRSQVQERLGLHQER